MGRWLRGRPLREAPASRGQVLVIFALGLVALLAAVGLAFDVGRLDMERRSLQNAADAGALAAANSLIRGGSTSDAEAEARAILAQNLAHGPNGIVAALPPSPPAYADGHAGEPSYLVNGIVISGGEVRVAIQNWIPYTFGRVVGLTNGLVSARARVLLQGDLLPVAARQYLAATGPYVGAGNPCPASPGGSQFADLVATADTSCLGSLDTGWLRTDPSPGLALDPANPNNDTAHHGPIAALVGEGAAAANDQSFRGFLALDIRNFADNSSNVFYNGVTADTHANTLKGLESGWVVPGYPGPAFPPVISPPDPNDQVGIMSGNSSGLVVDAIGSRYTVGSEVLMAVYSGTTMTIPDFAYTVAPNQVIGLNANLDGSVAMSVTKNNSFNGMVSTSAIADWGDPANPLVGPNPGLCLDFGPDPATPPTTVRWIEFRTGSACPGSPPAPAPGIYAIWIKGHSSSPYLTDHYYPVELDIGNVGGDVNVPSPGDQHNPTPYLTALNPGDVASGTFTISNAGLDGTIQLSVEGGADANDHASHDPPGPAPLPVGIGSTSISPSSITFNASGGGNQTVTLSIGSGTLPAGQYHLAVRATGTNGSGQKVTHVIPVELTVATGSTTDEYVDIQGFAVFRITSLDSNSVSGYAISGVYADMNDPALRRGQTARLVPWS